jgi:hypothetical protein
MRLSDQMGKASLLRRFGSNPIGRHQPLISLSSRVADPFILDPDL